MASILYPIPDWLNAENSWHLCIRIEMKTFNREQVTTIATYSSFYIKLGVI